MSEILGVNSAANLQPLQPSGQKLPKTTIIPTLEQNDTVVISNEARVASRLADVPPVRTDLVARVRAEIQAGTYDTDAKMDQALNRLMDELNL